MGGGSVTLGLARRHGDLLDPVAGFCDEQLGEGSIYGLLHRERDRLFPDEMFADLYQPRGRRSVPPSVLACVLVLQRLEGLSDREATDRFTYDARWRYACGVGGWDTGWTSFDHSVLVRFRMRLEDSADPRRIFRVSTAVAAEAGLIGIKRVLDSAPLFDAVATQDTVTLIRSAVRGLLRCADPTLGAALRAVL
jgi:transposase